MNLNIIIITSHYLKEPIEKIFSQLDINCKTKVVPYDNFKSISQVYDAYAEEADGFLISGTVARAAVEALDHEFTKPCLAFDIDIAGLYRTILNLLLEKRSMDMGRLILDFLIPIGGGITANDFLHDLNIDTVPPHIKNWIKNLSIEEIRSVEESTVNELTRLFDEHKIDMVLCQYSSIIPSMEKHGIPYIYPLPGKEHLKRLAHTLLSTIELEHMRANLPVIINVAPRSSQMNTPLNIHRLKEHMDEFFRLNMMDCKAEETRKHCSAITTIEILHNLTSHGKNCKICGFLAEKLDFEIAAGYGIGINFETAIKNSYTARKEAAIYGNSFIQNENGDLIGPLNTDNRMIIENHFIQGVGKIAKKCSLSPITIKKVMAAMKLNKSDKITTHDLANRLGGTVRNANRILLGLEHGGYAKPVYTQTTNSKGRPTKVYELDFGLQK